LNNAQPTTNNIASKGFRGMRRFVARFNFCCTLIGNRPQLATFHMLSVMHHAKECKMDYFVNVKDLNQLTLILTMMWGKIQYIGLSMILADSIPDNFRQTYFDNENEL